MQERKTRMLSIRISEDEYETLKSNTHGSGGTRSVSAFARQALQRAIRNSAAERPDLEMAMRSFDHRLGVLQNEVSRLSRTIAERLSGEMDD